MHVNFRLVVLESRLGLESSLGGFQLELGLALKRLRLGFRLALKGLGLALKDLEKLELFNYRKELLLNFESQIYNVETVIIIFLSAILYLEIASQLLRIVKFAYSNFAFKEKKLT